ncbi:cytochrome c-type biogenesis protein CcmH [Mesorhizobium sp. RP14(2022)]|uniref:Cytochrome c-type biogenesis protein n=1 Tax=Mesorhizobium liriopis TaxID=2953882 RepID=A0ABT1C1F5_9HYPH|nr:cytochrome c-type biogenesis protein [Mesorhizobium liriopis]MCO6048654.1 cytochrome c-type biogenesis protein CcmH [Mesorhizobium liriopis]
MRLRTAFLLTGLWLASAVPGLAVQPDEILADPAMETRARQLSAQLRCMVCQNQSIDDSDADLARDLRILVRDRLKAGDSDGAVLDYVVSRYGEFVLLKPRWNWRNAALWATPVVILVLGASFLLASAHQRKAAKSQGLNADERTRLDEILGRDA